jgi:hypothetical protein
MNPRSENETTTNQEGTRASDESGKEPTSKQSSKSHKKGDEVRYDNGNTSIYVHDHLVPKETPEEVEERHETLDESETSLEKYYIQRAKDFKMEQQMKVAIKHLGTHGTARKKHADQKTQDKIPKQLAKVFKAKNLHETAPSSFTMPDGEKFRRSSAYSVAKATLKLMLHFFIEAVRHPERLSGAPVSPAIGVECLSGLINLREDKSVIKLIGEKAEEIKKKEDEAK